MAAKTRSLRSTDLNNKFPTILPVTLARHASVPLFGWPALRLSLALVNDLASSIIRDRYLHIKERMETNNLGNPITRKAVNMSSKRVVDDNRIAAINDIHDLMAILKNRIPPGWLISSVI